MEEEYVNKTHIVFNSKFKEFINLLKREKNDILQQTNNRSNTRGN